MAPQSGYTLGESYILNIGTKVHSDKGKILKNECKLHFNIRNANCIVFKDKELESDIRGQNIGSQILKQAEETAKERGCKYTFLDTFSFQAPMFYKKYGYKEVFVLEEYPVSGKRYYFTKTL